jgi:hypothetical protein
MREGIAKNFDVKRSVNFTYKIPNKSIAHWISSNQSDCTNKAKGRHLKDKYFSLIPEWQLYSKNPIVSQGKTGEWDELSSSWGSIVLCNRNQWLMYFSGRDSSKKLRIGVAFSEDGLEWRKYGNNPVLSCGPPGNWDADGVYCPIVWKEKDYGLKIK